MRVEYDREADALYVEFREAEFARGVALDTERQVDYDAEGRVIGVEFLDVSHGINLEGVPERADVERLIQDQPHQFKVFA